MSKRSKFVLVSSVLAISLWLSMLAPVDYRFGLSISISALAYVLSVWVLFDDLKGIEWLTLMVLPVMFTFGCALFANFLPVVVPRMLGMSFQLETGILMAGIVRVVYFLLYAVGMYGVLLIENIFSVASIRTIQLYRAARSVNFILTLVSSLCFFTVAFSLKMEFWWVGLIVFVASYILSFPSFWSVEIKNSLREEINKYSVATSWVVAMSAAALCFWPIKPFMGGLLLTAILYACLGTLEQRLTSRVYLESILEYGLTVLVIIIIGFLTTSWVG